MAAPVSLNVTVNVVPSAGVPPRTCLPSSPDGRSRARIPFNNLVNVDPDHKDEKIIMMIDRDLKYSNEPL